MAYLEFNVPDGWTGLDEVEEDGKKDFVCTVQRKGDGTACITAIEGIPLESEEDEPEEVEIEEGVKSTGDPDRDREERYRKKFRGDMYAGG